MFEPTPERPGVNRFRVGEFTMFNDLDMKRLAVSALGAMALTAACVGAAVAPAAAATPLPATIDAWQDRVEAQISSHADPVSLRMAPGVRAEAVLAVRFAADGSFEGADIARSTGRSMLDRHALRVAGDLQYPPLPAAMQGKPHTIAMRLYFGRADTQQQATDMSRDLESVRIAEAGRAANGTVAVK
jgi:TonB family protein